MLNKQKKLYVELQINYTDNSCLLRKIVDKSVDEKIILKQTTLYHKIVKQPNEHTTLSRRR